MIGATQMPGAQMFQPAPAHSFAPQVMMPAAPQVMMQQPMQAMPMGASYAPPMAMQMPQQPIYPTYGAPQQSASFLPPMMMPGMQQVGAPQAAPGVRISAPQQVAPAQHVASVASVQGGERVRLKGIAQNSPYYGKTFIVEVPNVGNGQARVKLEGTETSMVMSPAFLESAHAPMAEPANFPQVAGHNPAWLNDNMQAQSAKADGLGNQLQAGDHVQLRGKSQYTGCAMTVEAIDCGDGRVRVTLQKPDGSMSRMAFDPQHLERVGGTTIVTHVVSPQTVMAQEQMQPAQMVEYAAPQVQYVQQEQQVQYVQQEQQVQYVQQEQQVQYVQQEQQVQYMQQMTDPAGAQVQQGQPGFGNAFNGQFTAADERAAGFA